VLSGESPLTAKKKQLVHTTQQMDRGRAKVGSENSVRTKPQKVIKYNQCLFQYFDFLKTFAFSFFFFFFFQVLNVPASKKLIAGPQAISTPIY
jgi:hypothetical protein